MTDRLGEAERNRLTSMDCFDPFPPKLIRHVANHSALSMQIKKEVVQSLLEQSNLILKDGKKNNGKDGMVNVLANAFEFTRKANAALKKLK